MAGRIAGITIEIGGDTSNLQKSLKGVDTQLKTTQNNLKDINKLLKLNPSSVELLTQKQKALKDAVQQTKDRLQQLKEAQKGVKEGTPEWDALQREIIATEGDLKKAEGELRGFGSVAAQVVAAAGKKMQELGQKVEKVGKELSKISGAAAGALVGLGKLGYNTMQAADELTTLSAKTGVSTDELQKWQYASELVDVEMGTITSSLTKMKKNMDSNSDAFEKLGVATKDELGNFRSVDDVFYDTVAILSRIEDPVERDIAAMEIFGKGADDLAGIIDDGGAALKQYGQEAENMGLILGGDTLDKLNEANDTVDRLKGTFKGSFAQAGATLVEKFAPALEKVAEFLTTVAEKIASLTPEQAEMIVKILAVVAAIGPLVLVVGKIISGIGTLMTILPLLAGPFGIVLAVVAAVVAIGIVLYKNWDTIKAKAQEVWTNVVAAWEGLKAGVTAAVDAVSSWVTEKWDAIKTSVTTTVDTLKTSVTTAWEGLKTSVSSVIDGIKSKIDGFKQKLDSLKTKAQTVVDKIKGIFSGEISFPSIKLPHFKVWGGEAPYGLGGKGSLPKISIDWYKQAYQNPVLFTSPTVLPTAAGLKGFGDGSGAEIVMGLDKLRELVASGNQNVTVQVVLEGDARQLFKAVQRTNLVRTKATNYNALAVGG